MRMITRFALMTALATGFVVSKATALSVIPPSFQELVSTADVVVDGEVTGVRSELSSYEGRPVVHTYVTVRVLDSMKGAPGESIELRMLGGSAGGITMQVSGLPKFTAGQRNLFFVEGNGVNFCPLVAVNHGYYPIVKRQSDGVEVIVRSNGEPLGETSEVSEELHGAAHPAEGGGDLGRAMSVADFKTRIRAEVAHAREQ